MPVTRINTKKEKSPLARWPIIDQDAPTRTASSPAQLMDNFFSDNPSRAFLI